MESLEKSWYEIFLDPGTPNNHLLLVGSTGWFQVFKLKVVVSPNIHIKKRFRGFQGWMITFLEPETSGCFSWMTLKSLNHYHGKIDGFHHFRPVKNGCLGFQVSLNIDFLETNRILHVKYLLGQGYLTSLSLICLSVIRLITKHQPRIICFIWMNILPPISWKSKTPCWEHD